MPVQNFNPNIPLTIPDGILNKIQYLCYKIPKVEWSGVLFYSIKGDITDPSEFSVTIEDILPMDKGSSAYTEYDLDSRFVDYLMDNPDAMDWKVGHIHSHNIMNVFFSHTDMTELNDNAPNHNYYLSLIVNNFNEFCAKLCYVAETEIKEIEVEYKALNSEGDHYIVGIIPSKVNQKLLCVHDCDIIVQKPQYTAEQGFMDKVDVLLKPKPVVKKTFSGIQGKVWNKDTGKWETPVIQLPENPLTNPNLTEDRTDVEIFVLTLLNFTNPPDPNDDVAMLLEELEQLQVTSFDLATSIGTNYNSVYEKLFNDVTSDEHFMAILIESIEELENYNDMYPIINDSIAQLELIKEQYEAAQETLEYGTTE